MLESSLHPSRVPAVTCLAAALASIAGCGAPPPSSDAGPVPDQQVVFMMTGGAPAGGPTSEVGLVNLDGTGLQQLTSDGTYKFLPHFSPDGSRIAYTKYAVGVYGSPTRRPTSPCSILARGEERMVSTWRRQRPGHVVTLDGKQLAYLGGTRLATGSAIWVVDADGSNAQQIRVGWRHAGGRQLG